MTSNLVKAGFVVGILWNAYFIWRYLIRYEDASQALLFSLVGIGIIAFSFLYNLHLKEREERKKSDEKLKQDRDDIVTKIRNKIKNIDDVMEELIGK